MTQIKQQVMASVALIYITRRLTSPRALKAYALLLSFGGVVLFASVPHVVANFVHIGSAGLPAIGIFLLSAVTKTNLVVQLALLMGGIAVTSLMRDMLSKTPNRRFA